MQTSLCIIKTLKFLSLLVVILDLIEIIPVKQHRIWIVSVYFAQRRPYLIRSFILIDDVQAQFVDHIQIYHVRIQVRPELDVVGGALLDGPLELTEERLEDNHNREIQIRVLASVTHRLEISLKLVLYLRLYQHPQLIDSE